MAWLFAIVVPLASCGGGESAGQSASSGAGGGPASSTLHGVVQKGPYQQDTPIQLGAVDATFAPTGATYTIATSDAAGTFTFAAQNVSAPYLDAIADGFYFDEISGALSGAPLKLRALFAMTSLHDANLNVLTTLQRPRVMHLVQQGQAFEPAQQQSQSEALAAFGIQVAAAPPSSALTIADAGEANAALLAVSAILQEAAWEAAPGADQVTAELTALLTAVSSDLEPDGTLDDPALKQRLDVAAHHLDAAAVRANLEGYYAKIGVAVTVPQFEKDLPSANAGSFVTAGDLPGPRADHAATLLPGGDLLVAGGTFATGGMGSLAYANAVEIDPMTLVVVATHATTGEFSSPLAAALSGSLLLVGADATAPTVSAIESFDTATKTFSPVAAFENGLDIGSRWFDAVPLLDGRVLFIRNQGGTPVTELYDPATGTRTNTGPMVQQHGSAPATRLPSGSVLIAGGGSDPMGDALPIASAELFDPATDTWSALPSMSVPRLRHTQTLLSDGRVLVAGGEGTSAVQSSAEVFDPITKTWSAVPGGMAVARAWHEATLLADGRVLLTGGADGKGGVLEAAEVYDPATNRFTTIPGGLVVARSYHSATALPDGSALIIGGANVDGVLSSIEHYVP